MCHLKTPVVQLKSLHMPTPDNKKVGIKMRMEMKKNLLELEEIIADSNLDKKIYDSEDFYTVRLALSLLKALT